MADMTQVQWWSCLQEVIKQTEYLCPKYMLLSNTPIDLDMGAHLSNHTLLEFQPIRHMSTEIWTANS